jgi:uncharacterized protein (DUF934 family)
VFVQSVVGALTAITLIACAVAVFSSYRALSAAKKLRSMTSLQGELVEIRDYLSKLDAWAKRINARDTMRDRRASVNEQSESSKAASGPGETSNKDELRRRAGLVAGQPARHRELQ